ncbi:lysM and putative peptidoglycan-binding domain-containing protein 4 [Rhinophrynus dorsalis]
MRLREGRSHSFQPHSAVHSSCGSHVYTFTNGTADSDSSSEDEFDAMELRVRGAEQQRQNASREKVGDMILLERVITEDDNLNKLALQYGCKVADIKRVNNLIREQDIYALKTIKIPVKVHGLLTETCDELSPHQSLNSSVLIESSEEVPTTSTENQDLRVYFREIDQNIEAAQTQELFNESFALNSQIQLSAPLLGQKQPSSGADWGIRWWNAVLIMLLIGIVLPVFYIIYFKTQGASGSLFLFWNQSNSSTAFGTNIDTVTLKNTILSSKNLQDLHKPLITGG